MKLLVIVSSTIFTMIVLIVLSYLINTYLFKFDFDFLIGFWTGIVYVYCKQNVDKIILQIKYLFKENYENL